MTGLIDDAALDMMQREFQTTFDTTVEWYQQVYDAQGNPANDLYGNKTYQQPKTLPARVTTELEEEYTPNQVIQKRFARISLPPHTGVRAGDIILVQGQQWKNRVPVVGVAEIPTSERAVFEFVTIGIGV